MSHGPRSEPSRPGSRPGSFPGPRPKKPPGAPPELVALLKKSKRVQEYFIALQRNLQYDVAKWKDRARELEKHSPAAAAAAAGSSEEANRNDPSSVFRAGTRAEDPKDCRTEARAYVTATSMATSMATSDASTAPGQGGVGIGSHRIYCAGNVHRNCRNRWNRCLLLLVRFTIPRSVSEDESVPKIIYSEEKPGAPQDPALESVVDDRTIHDDESDPESKAFYDLRNPQSRSACNPSDASSDSTEILIHEESILIRGIEYCRGRASSWEEVVLFEDPTNIHDSNAIRVCTIDDGIMIGHMDRKNALRLAPLLKQRSPLSLRFCVFAVQSASKCHQKAVVRVYCPTDHRKKKSLEFVPIAKASYTSHCLRNTSNGVQWNIMTNFATADYDGGLMPCQDKFRKLVQRNGVTNLQKKYIPIAEEIMFGGTRGKTFSHNLFESERINKRLTYANGYEVHHMIPLCCGGAESNPFNLLFLLTRDHYLLHAILMIVFANKSLVMALNSFKMRFEDRVLEEILEPYPDLREEIELVASHFKHDSEYDFLDMYIQCRRYVEGNGGKLPTQDRSALGRWVMNIQFKYQQERQNFTEKELELLHEIGMFRNILEAERQEREKKKAEKERLMERLKEKRRIEMEKKKAEKEEHRLKEERLKKERRLKRERKKAEKEERRLKEERLKEEQGLERERKKAEKERLKERLKEERRLERERKKEQKKEERRLKEKRLKEEQREAQEELWKNVLAEEKKRKAQTRFSSSQGTDC